MTNDALEPLRCPKCGAGTDLSEEDSAAFGLRVTCSYCGTLSVLVVNRQLRVSRGSERVCTECGLVASRKARFCQCGANLTKKCEACSRETAIDHVRCDQCGVNLGRAEYRVIVNIKPPDEAKPAAQWKEELRGYLDESERREILGFHLFWPCEIRFATRRAAVRAAARLKAILTASGEPPHWGLAGHVVLPEGEAPNVPPVRPDTGNSTT